MARLFLPPALRSSLSRATAPFLDLLHGYRNCSASRSRRNFWMLIRPYPDIAKRTRGEPDIRTRPVAPNRRLWTCVRDPPTHCSPGGGRLSRETGLGPGSLEVGASLLFVIPGTRHKLQTISKFKLHELFNLPVLILGASLNPR